MKDCCDIQHGDADLQRAVYRRILWIVQQAGDIAAQVQLSQSLVSHHLRLLRAARLLNSRRCGKQVFYWAADEHIRSVLKDMAEHVSEPDGHQE